MNKQDCPAPGCTNRVPAEAVACSKHWFELPSPLRRAIHRAQRADNVIALANLRRDAMKVWDA